VIVLGLNAYGHDAAAVLLIDGRPVFAASEERYDRVRHSGAFPRGAIAAALAHAGLGPRDVACVAFPWMRGMARVRKALHVLRHWPRSRAFLRERPDAALPDRRGYLRAMAGLGSDLAALGIRCPVVRVPHHLAHAASARLALDDPQGPAAVLTADGMGEWTTTALWAGVGGRLRSLATASYPHSAGKVYSAVTAWLGFRPESDEGKTMGLAAYGDPATPQAQFARRLLSVHPRHLLRASTGRLGYPFGEARLYGDAFLEALGPARRPDEALRPADAHVARGIQDALEDVMLRAAERALRETRAAALGLAGGVFLNCALNGRLLRALGRGVRPFPVAGDAGAAWGAAAWVAGRRGASLVPLASLRLGHDLAPAEAARAAPDALALPLGDLAARTAQALAAGRVVGVARGRAELGPRALGGRSVLASPRRTAMRDEVNRRKGREAWRPLAPVVRADAQAWFPGLAPSPHMILTFEASPRAKAEIPGAVHVDGTARVQTLAPGTEPFLEGVLAALEARGEPPCTLNTSLNRRGEPIVNDAEQALAAARAMGLDALVLADRWVELARG
jgi:carbamoyltransferase